MKLGARIFLAYLLLFSLCLAYPLNWIADTLGARYREGVEDSLVDQANILAAFVEEEMRQQRFAPEQWQAAFARIHGRELAARIYTLSKQRVDCHVYITDARGMVAFDSENPANVGRDYSQWRDVFHTLQGRYGARTSRSNADDESSSVLHVAAPIRIDGALVGVLTVAKPTTNIRYFVDSARTRIFGVGALSLFASGLLSLLVAAWITRPIKRLTGYAKGIRDGEQPHFPPLDSSEIGEMGRAFAEMQETLEGKRYVEQYVEHLTHELKSPLSAIRGAAELLTEPMEAARRDRFLGNIRSQAQRIQEIVDRMLELAALEHGNHPLNREGVSIAALVNTVREAKEPLLHGKRLRLDLRLDGETASGLGIRGDGFLLHQALANLVQNAIDFSPEQGVICLTAEQVGEQIRFTVTDQGPGIPEFARGKVFDKFFSLQRPDTGQKSTGLGLSFVRQVALLHDGWADVGNLPEGGAQAVFVVGRG